MSESGLTRVGGVVVLSGQALRAARDCALIAVKHRKMSGVPYQAYEALACELNETMAAAGQSVNGSPAVRKAAGVDEQPTVPIAEAAARLRISVRQARRVAPKLGGRMIAGRWFVDELALRQHLEGKQQ
ncbi:hypothetical protein [Mycolicibacterium baixiangningiae]|uniref:hypothetical protein n=1 Tax=Mycolicibacterium baixiangningiae TaxID=2761578 RepID=UPI001869415F|nr:hypothetical protein [Mycolicibacterium baixiangningiae]